MADVVGLETATGIGETPVSDVKFSLADATTAFQRTAAALMAAHSGDGLQKVMYVPPNSTPMARAANTPAGESLKPALATKTGISFVIPKNKLSGALVPVLRTSAGSLELNEPKKDEIPQRVPEKKTRWGVDLTQDPAVKRGRALALQTRAEQIAAQLESGQLDIDNNEVPRSPSPPPIYDLNGQRINTREGRRREQLERERREAIGECLQLNPLYKPPPGYKPSCKEAKLYIPVKDYPGYNFIGLILGPRGNTQKRMEAETGSKIAIRGKGAVKEGKKNSSIRLQGGRRDAKEAEGAFEDLHVHITADSIEKVDAAVALIEPLLTPVDEDRNTHKRKQLRELAEMNGTMRDFAKVCSLCGDSIHREWLCPKDKLYSYQAKANVCCQICGNGGHPTMDCPDRQSGQGKILDKEYLNFLEELGDGLSVPSAGSTQVQSSKLPAERTVKADSPAAPLISTSSTPVASNEISETSRDPNQLADVVRGQQPMLITASGPQPIPPAWASGEIFRNEFDSQLISREGNFVQIDGEVQFQDAPSGLGPTVQPRNSGGFSEKLAPFMYQGHPPPMGGALAKPPLNVVRVDSSGEPGRPTIQPMASGSYGRESVLQATDLSSASGKFPGQKEGGLLLTSIPTLPNGRPFGAPLPIPNSSSHVSFIPPHARESCAPSPSVTHGPFGPSLTSPSSSGPANLWNQNVSPQKAISGSAPMLWEGATHAQPPPLFWSNGPGSQQLPSFYHVPSPPPWEGTGASTSITEQKSWGNGSSRPAIAPMPPSMPRFPVTFPAGAPPKTFSVEGSNQSWNSRHIASPVLTLPPPPPQPLPLPTNQPWKVQQPQIGHHATPSETFPVPKSSFSVWRGASSSPDAISMPISRGHPRPPPQLLGTMQTNQSPLQTHPPPRLQQAGLNSELRNFTSFSGPIMFPPLGDAPDLHRSITSSTPLTVNNRTPFESRFSATVPSQFDVSRQPSYPPYDPFVPTVTPALANANAHQQQAPMVMVGGQINTNVSQQQAAMPKAVAPSSSIVYQQQPFAPMQGAPNTSNLHPTQPGMLPRLSHPSNPNVHQPQVAMPMHRVSSHPSAHHQQAVLPIVVSPTNSNIPQQQAEMSMLGVAGSAGFGGLPDQISGRSQSVLSNSNIGRNQPSMPMGRPPWHFLEQNPRLPILSPGPAVLQSAPVAAAETDAEYEKLMASVGVK